MAQEGACREACPLAQPPPILRPTYTLPADGGGRRLHMTTTSPRALPRAEGAGTSATAGGDGAVAVAMWHVTQ